MKFKKTAIVFIVIILLFGILLAIALPSIAKRNENGGENTENIEVNQSVVQAQTLGGAPLSGASIQPMSWWGGIIGGGIVGGIITGLIPKVEQVYGTVHAGNQSTIVSSGSYTNLAFGYTAHSGFDRVQIRHQSESEHSGYWHTNSMMWSNSNRDGWYYLRGMKSSNNNVSLESSICLDTVKPQIQVRYNGATVPNGYITNGAASFSLLGSDSLSGVNTYWYKIGNGAYYQCYSSSTFSANGVYTFYCVDRAGNVSDTITVTKDTVAPSIYIYNGGASLSNNAVTNASSLSLQATDATSGLEGIYVKSPSSSSFAKYTSNSVSVTAVGTYQFYARDKAGNQSSTYTFTIDRTAPTMTVKSGSTTLSSNRFINTSSITAASNESGTCYVYRTSTGTTTTFTSGSSFTAEDTYRFYSTDKAGNKSSEITVTIDRTAPTGNIYAGGSLTTAAYTKATSIYYTASDKNSFSVYVKEPNKTSYALTTNSKTFTAEGTYSFYTTDAAGNQSAVRTITVDRVKPTVSLYAGTTAANSEAYVNTEYIYATASDSLSGIKTIYVKLPRASSYSFYTSGTRLSEQGAYSFYSEDNAGNISDTKMIYLDKTAPVGTLYVGGSAVANDSYTNKAFTFKATDNLSGVARCEIKKPNGTWESYTSGASVTGTNGVYYFRAVDVSGNVSAESRITRDTAAPVIQVLGDGIAKATNSYINAASTAFHAFDGNLADCFIKLPNESAFRSVSSGAAYTAEGRYEFYATDKAGNKSATFVITIDKTKPAGTMSLTADGKVLADGSYVNAPFKYTATDALSGVNRCEVKKPNGAWEAYASGSELKGTNGTYYFRAYDNAGNVSAESYLIYDTAAPTVTAYAGTAVAPDKSFTNAAYIKFTASDANLQTCHVKLPNENTFKATTSGVEFTAEGRYEFYAVDMAGNQSAVTAIILDRTAPVGTLTADGVISSNGDYTNKPFKFTATDSLSGIARLEIKKPNGAWEAYTSGTEIKSGASGIYSFRAYDNAGNISAESFVNFSVAAPTVTVFAGTNAVPSNSFTNADYVKFEANHIYLDTCYVKLPDTSVFQLVPSGAQFTASGRYEFYAVDKCGNVSEIYAVTLDKVNPVGTLYVGDTVVGSETYTNKAFKYEADGGLSGLAYCEIKRPDGTWERYAAGTLIGAGYPDGAYSFRSADNVGNVSAVSVIHLDTAAPTGSLFADEVAITSGSFTNALRIKFVSGDANLASCYVRLPNADSFEPTSSGALYSAVGRYEFYAVDLAGNVSETYVVNADRTPKTVTLGNVANNKTTQNVQLTWKDTAGFAPIVSVTVNGIAVTNNTVVKTIDGGKYEVICTDAAGNVWTSVFTAERSDIETTTTNKYWYEAKDGAGNTYAFESYEKALAFAVQRETELVKPMTWNGSTWDTGYIMDSVDAVNAKQGTFYLYKKHDDPKIEVAYFTLERLNAVIRQYAEQDINKYFYWEKNPAAAHVGNDINAPVTGGKITAKSLTLRADLTYKIDGVTLTGTSYSVSGNHVLTVFDEYGNSYTYDLAIVRSAPDIQFRYAGGDYYLASNEQPYYLKNRITIKLIDTLDDFAMAVVKDSNGNVLYVINLGEELIISEVGKYTIQTINHSGTREYVFYISYDDPSVYSLTNMNSKRLEVNVTPSKDKDISLLGIKVYRSADGSEWTFLDTDDYGNAVNIGTLKYSFYKTGFYRVIVEDICRSGIDAVVYETYFEKPAPVGSLNGVNGSGYASGAVSFTWTDEAYAVICFDGTESEYVSGTELTEEGAYKLVFRDYNGFEKEYAFIIDKTPATALMTNEPVNGYVKENAVTWEKDGVTAVLHYNGVQSGAYTKGTKLFADGQYKIELTDLAGNVSAVEFSIDNVAPTADIQGVENNGQTKSAVRLVNLSKQAEIKAYLNGAEFEYKIGDTLSEVGTYRFVLTDAAGNQTEYGFEILFALNASANIFIFIVIGVFAVGVALVVILRKKSKFKTKNKPEKEPDTTDKTDAV